MIIALNEPQLIPPFEYGIKPIYYIYKNSAIFSTYLNDFIKQEEDKYGYIQIALRTESGKYYRRGVHRILMMVYNFVPNYKELQVNHIDGNKKNNHISNLEWCTAIENKQHASRMGLVARGETANKAVLTNYQALAVGDMLLKNYPKEAIRKIVPEAHDEILYNIVAGKTWRFLFTDEEREIMKRNFSAVLLPDQVHSICKFFQDNKEKYQYPGGIQDMITAAYASIGKEPNFNVGYKTYRRKTNTKISSLYNF